MLPDNGKVLPDSELDAVTAGNAESEKDPTPLPPFCSCLSSCQYTLATCVNNQARANRFCPVAKKPLL